MPIIIEDLKTGISSAASKIPGSIGDFTKSLSTNVQNLANGVSNGLQALNGLPSSTTRLTATGLLPGGMPTLSSPGINLSSIQFNSDAGVAPSDWRVKCSVAAGSGVLYDMPSAGVMDPIKKTNGVIFPYAPTLSIQHTSRYSTQPLTHSNYNNYFYEGSEVQAINVTADFTVQNSAEALYFIGALYFFKTATKMFYGDSGKYQGAPPPIVYLDGYGAHYLPHVPCVVTSFNHTMPGDVDYIEVIASGRSTRVPTVSQLVVAFQPVYSRASQRAFNLEAFARGELVTKGYL